LNSLLTANPMRLTNTLLRCIATGMAGAICAVA
jgi:hypothetical protein